MDVALQHAERAAEAVRLADEHYEGSEDAEEWLHLATAHALTAIALAITKPIEHQ